MKLYSEHSRHLVAVDCIVFGYDILEKEIKLLLIKRSFEPARGKWSLAGGFVREKESLDEAASRILFQLTGLRDVYMEQSFTYGQIKRDPGARVISTSYSALIKIQDIDRKLKELSGAQWQSLARLPHLIFDHREMVDRALNELQMQVKAKPVGFALLPEKFTLVQLQDLYEAIYQREIDKR
ncbi:MAG: NUDIX domain-containing protein, partial [Bacteroidia bacterium]